MKHLFTITLLAISQLLFAQKDIKAFYQYTTSFPKSSLGDFGANIIYELNQKDNKGNFRIKEGERFYDNQFYYYDLDSKKYEHYQNYKGDWYHIFGDFENLDFVFSEETATINNCEAKKAEYFKEDFKVIEVWYCPSKTLQFFPLDRGYQYHQLPGYVVNLKVYVNNKAGQITEYKLLEFKENKAAEIVKPENGIKLTSKEAKEQFKVNAGF